MVQRDQPRGAGRVDGLRRPAQVEDVGDPVGDDGERRAGHHVAVRTRRVELPQVTPIGRAGAHVDAQVAAGDRGFGPARMLQRLAHQLQDQALLRVHLRRLARREAEARMVEAQHVAQRAGGEGVGLAWLLPPRMQPGGVVEAVGGDLGDRVAAGRQQRPEGRQIGRAGQPAGGADHRDRRRDGRPGGRPGRRRRGAHALQMAAPDRGRSELGANMGLFMARRVGRRQPAGRA